MLESLDSRLAIYKEGAADCGEMVSRAALRDHITERFGDRGAFVLSVAQECNADHGGGSEAGD